MLIGYARVSTDDQNLDQQRAALKEAGCRRVFEEKISGAKRDRPELARLLDQVREHDVVMVSRPRSPGPVHPRPVGNCRAAVRGRRRAALIGRALG